MVHCKALFTLQVLGQFQIGMQSVPSVHSCSRTQIKLVSPKPPPEVVWNRFCYFPQKWNQFQISVVWTRRFDSNQQTSSQSIIHTRNSLSVFGNDAAANQFMGHIPRGRGATNQFAEQIWNVLAKVGRARWDWLVNWSTGTEHICWGVDNLV